MENNEEMKKNLESIFELNNRLLELQLTATEKIDTRDYFICVYNNDNIGLFKCINYISNIEHVDYVTIYDAAKIFVSLDSDAVGIKKTHDNAILVNYSAPIGTNITFNNTNYIANCTIQDTIKFNDMRAELYATKPYQKDWASQEEIEVVLQFARTYFGLDQNLQRSKKSPAK